MLKFRNLVLGAALLGASAAAVPAGAAITATAAGRDMLHEMLIDLVTANNRMALVPASDLSQVTDIIAHLGVDAHVVYDAFYNTPVDTSGVCSRDDIVAAMDDLKQVISTYRDNLGNPPPALLVAFNRLSDRMLDIEDRLGDALNQAEAGC
ncbi:MAG: hypothetical protein R3F55_12525 [Alphaproteobacteria bacterium]